MGGCALSGTPGHWEVKGWKESGPWLQALRDGSGGWRDAAVLSRTVEVLDVG